MLFGAIFLLVGTACRYRWREHFALGGIFFNLTVAVGLSVSYVQHDRWVTSRQMGRALRRVMGGFAGRSQASSCLKCHEGGVRCAASQRRCCLWRRQKHPPLVLLWHLACALGLTLPSRATPPPHTASGASSSTGGGLSGWPWPSWCLWACWSFRCLSVSRLAPWPAVHCLQSAERKVHVRPFVLQQQPSK